MDIVKEIIRKLERIDFETVLVIIALSIGLVLSIVFAFENLASVIIGAFAGYLARTVKEDKGKVI